MSNIDIYKLLEDKRQRWSHSESADQAISDCIVAVRAAEERGYLGALYRTDFEVEGIGAFPVDMLRYTCSWPKGESDARSIEDSFEGSGRRTITLTKYHRDPEPHLAADRWLSKFRWNVRGVVATVEI